MDKKSSILPGITFTGDITVNGPMFDIHDNQHVHINTSQPNNSQNNNEEESNIPPNDEPLKNFIFNTSYFDTNDKLVKLRNTIAAAIDMGDDTCLYGEPQEKRINPSNKNEWYYIRKAIVESGVAKSNLADKDFVEQMVDWFPKLFPMEQVDTIEAEKRKLAKSISGERSRWRKGSTKQEVALKDTMASGMVRTLGTKAQLMFEIAYKGLCLRLSELKHEMSNVKKFQKS